MSRGLGTKQQHLLDLLDDPWRDGLAVGDIPTLLDVTERRARTIVASLVDRQLVAVSDDPDYGRRVWLPTKYRVWARDRAWFRHLFASLRQPPQPTKFCRNCGIPDP